MIHFITGNKDKFEEIKAILPEIERMKIDLPEIQEIDAHEIIRQKLESAQKHAKGEFMVEDTSLYLECLNGLPGPLIKWFLKTIGVGGLAGLAEKLENTKAEAKTVIGYMSGSGEIRFFEGIVKGQIISPRGEKRFEWDRIFRPDGHDKTFAEMGMEEKNKISMRRIAVNRLKKFLKA
ncbi:MAG: non-canonical purine NTP pyrophosphatase [Candidatus Sungbacteria bacterium]|nr:non-canonical purine NTP pyrophosphatase [Candidatus Sungbacteria bacterium]